MISYHLGISDFNLYSYRKNKLCFMEIDQIERVTIETELRKPIEQILNDIAFSISLYNTKFSRINNKIMINKPLKYQEERALIHAIGHSGIFKNDE